MTKKNARPLRLPNSWGSIVYLGEGRRRPYAAKTATAGYNAAGYPIRETLGYFETWQDAYEALSAYNANPYDVEARKIKFSEFYDLFMERRRANGISKSNEGILKAAYNHSAPLYDRKMIDIKSLELQYLLDDLAVKYKHSSLEATRSLWSQMWEMACELDYVQKNYARFVKINKTNDDEHGVPFSRAEIEQLWSVVGTVPDVDMILVMIYSGFRIAAFEKLEVDIKSKTFFGGVKTAAGKCRTVPIHSRIMPLIPELLASGRLFGEKPHTIRERWTTAVTASGVVLSSHTPHDCRTTLATELDHAGARDIDMKRILGHSIKDLTQKVYVKSDIEKLRDALELVK